MAKPWEETWLYFEPNAGFPGFAAEIGDGKLRVFESHAGEDDDRPRAVLAAAAPEMARLLLTLEERQTYEETTCATCDGPSAHNGARHPETLIWHIEHEPDCQWVAVLRKAGVRD